MGAISIINYWPFVVEESILQGYESRYEVPLPFRVRGKKELIWEQSGSPTRVFMCDGRDQSERTRSVTCFAHGI